MTYRPGTDTTHRPRRDGREQVLALGRFAPFAGCSRADLRRIDSLTCELDVPAGRVLVREGEPANQALFVTAGWARATCGSVMVGCFEPGSCIAGREVAAHLPNPVTVTTETTVTVLAASAREFRSLVDIPAIAEVASASPIQHDAPAEPVLVPAPVPVPVVDETDDVARVRASWLSFPVVDDDWPRFAAAMEGARTFWAAARNDPGVFES